MFRCFTEITFCILKIAHMLPSDQPSLPLTLIRFCTVLHVQMCKYEQLFMWIVTLQCILTPQKPITDSGPSGMACCEHTFCLFCVNSLVKLPWAPCSVKAVRDTGKILTIWKSKLLTSTPAIIFADCNHMTSGASQRRISMCRKWIPCQQMQTPVPRDWTSRTASAPEMT